MLKISLLNRIKPARFRSKFKEFIGTIIYDDKFIPT